MGDGDARIEMILIGLFDTGGIVRCRSENRVAIPIFLTAIRHLDVGELPGADANPEIQPVCATANTQ